MAESLYHGVAKTATPEEIRRAYGDEVDHLADR
jgi:hypothetical protein